MSIRNDVSTLLLLIVTVAFLVALALGLRDATRERAADSRASCARVWRVTHTAHDSLTVYHDFPECGK
jgi:hypothetical protein